MFSDFEFVLWMDSNMPGAEASSIPQFFLLKNGCRISGKLASEDVVQDKIIGKEAQESHANAGDPMQEIKNIEQAAFGRAAIAKSAVIKKEDEFRDPRIKDTLIILDAKLEYPDGGEVSFSWLSVKASEVCAYSLLPPVS